MVTDRGEQDEPDPAAIADLAGGGTSTTRLRQSLPVRVAVLLSLSLLPLGLIALIQSWRLIEASEDVMEAALLARTAEFVAPEREAIFVEIGRARSLADSVAMIDTDGSACQTMMQRAVTRSDRLQFAGFFDAPGRSPCNSSGGPVQFDASGPDGANFENRQPVLAFSPVGRVTGLSVIIVSEPVRTAQGRFLGFVSTSFPVRTINPPEGGIYASFGMIYTFNHRGERLTHTIFGPDKEADPTGLLPRDISLADLARAQRSSFVALDREGRRRHFALVTIAEGQAYALGSWPAQDMAGSSWTVRASTILFPLLMWAVSIGVAVAAMNRLVLRHIRGLGRRMRGFAENRRLVPSDEGDNPPTELRDISETFDRMAQKIIHDEAELENAIYERGVLMKEVHHRVKNNLQQILSIINMQLRETRAPEARTVLREFGDRVMGLASVYRALYQEPSVANVRMDALLEELLGQIVVSGSGAQARLSIERELEPIRLLPDQAGALAMLTAEALVYLFRHGTPDAEGRTRLCVRLYRDAPEPGHSDDGQICLFVSDTGVRDGQTEMTGADRADPVGDLGTKLISAFAMQLNTQAERIADAEGLRIKVCFDADPV